MWQYTTFCAMIIYRFIGGDYVRKFLNSHVGIVVGFVILLPILLIICIGYLLFVPFDIIRYHRMPYFKDFKKKYEFFLTSQDVVKIYNRIVKEQLPIEYVKYNDYEYFITDGQVLLCGWGNEDFTQEDDDWFFVFSEEDDNKLSIREAIEWDMELLKPEHKCLPVKFLISYDDITDAEKFEKAKECPYFHCVFLTEEL